MLDIKVQAAAAQRVANLPALVRRQDDVRRVLRPNRTELGNGHLEIRQQLEEKRLEGLVGPIDLVDEQDRQPDPSE